jgi:integrase
LRQQIDVHKVRDRYERAIKLLRSDTRISTENKRTIISFLNDIQAEGVRLARVVKYLYLLPELARRLKKDFVAADIEDLKKLVASINGSTYSDSTKSDFRVALKRFYRWIRKCPPGQSPPEIAWIKCGDHSRRVLPEELLTDEEVLRMAEVCENSRDRAFLLCTSETGGRIGELLNLRRKHVEFDQYGVILRFSGKTGDRPVRAVASSAALAQWMSDHPSKEPDAPFWVVIGDKSHGHPLLYHSSRALLRRLAKRAGVKKRVNPQSFRHARASLLANALTERQMEQYLGWTPGSKMPKVYVHLSGRDIDSALLRMHGIATQEHQNNLAKLTRTMCPRCKLSNGPTDKFCGKCGLPLSVEAAMEYEKERRNADDLMSRLLEDPAVRELLLTKLRSLTKRGEASPQETFFEV